MYTAPQRAMLASLPEGEAKTLLLLFTFPGGVALSELAEVLGVPPISVRLHLVNMATKKLVEEYEKDRYRTPLSPEPWDTRLARELMLKGLSQQEAEHCLSFGVERVERQIRWLPYRRNLKNIPAYLIWAIEKDDKEPYSISGRRWHG